MTQIKAIAYNLIKDFYFLDSRNWYVRFLQGDNSIRELSRVKIGEKTHRRRKLQFLRNYGQNFDLISSVNLNLTNLRKRTEKKDAKKTLRKETKLFNSRISLLSSNPLVEKSESCLSLKHLYP